MTARPQVELNDWQTYHGLVAQRLQPGQTVLEVGCGRGDVAPFPWEEHPGVTLIGADIDSSAARNPAITRFVQLPSSGAWSIPRSGVDLVLARYVFEHIDDPAEFLSNVGRALKPDGELIFLTPNRRHPAMAVSRLLPTSLKRGILLRTGHADPHDVFPTRYRMNTPNTLLGLARDHGFAVSEQQTREYAPCGYLSFCAAGRLLARGYRSLLAGSRLESHFGAQIIGRWRKRRLYA